MPASATLVRKRGGNDMRKLLPALFGYVENAGTPVSSLTPEHIGQICFDTSGSDFYIAKGVANTDWIPFALDELSAAEHAVLDGVTAGTGAASKAAVLDASGNFLMPDGGFLNLSNAAVAAAGSGQSTYTAIADQINAVTGADATKGVALPAASAGRAILVINTDQSNVLPVAPVNGGNDTINSLTAGTGVFTMGPGKAAWFIPTSATQWYVSGHAAIVGTPTEQELNGILASVAEINRAADVSTRIVNCTASTLAVTEADHDGKTIVLDLAAGIAVTLPAAAAGLRFRFIVKTTFTGAASIKSVSGADIMVGRALMGNDADNTVVAWPAIASDTFDTIDLLGTANSTGGMAGQVIEIEGLAANLWAVNITGDAAGTEATPFQNTVA